MDEPKAQDISDGGFAVQMIGMLEEHLKYEGGRNGVPELSTSARRALAEQIVRVNGYLDPIKIRTAALVEAKTNPKWKNESVPPGIIARIKNFVGIGS